MLPSMPLRSKSGWKNSVWRDSPFGNPLSDPGLAREERRPLWGRTLRVRPPGPGPEHGAKVYLVFNT